MSIVLPLDRLHHLDRPHRRGHATGNLPGMAPGVPGFLELGPVRLVGMERFTPGYEGFAMHAHDNMEIVDIMVAGRFSHRDTLGDEVSLGSEDVQVMSAGSGIAHEEFTHGDPCIAVHLMIEPAVRDARPSCRHRTFPRADRRDRLVTLVGPGGVPIGQDVEILGAVLSPGVEVAHTVRRGCAYLLVVRGTVAVGGEPVREGERALVRGGALVVRAAEEAEVVLVDVGA